MKPKLTVQQAVFLAEKCDKLFERAAQAWVRGNNSADVPGYYERMLKLQGKLHDEAEALLAPLKITVDYPGLYPSFTVNGFDHHDALSAISAALERPSARGKGKVCV